MESAENFVRYFNKSFIRILNEKRSPEKRNNYFLSEFVELIPKITQEMQMHLDQRQLSSFYLKLNSLKYLIEYSDDLNKYWFLLRAYSGGLKRLTDVQTLENAQNVYLYYRQRYGDRRILKDENWFEEKRWHFLDQLIRVENDDSLRLFIDSSIRTLNEYFFIYKTELLNFRNDVDKLIHHI